jgi:ATP-dependent DNA ligase
VQALLDSPLWAMEEKFDGDRLLIVYKNDDQVNAYGRQGTECIVPRIKTARQTLEFTPLDSWHKGTTVLDGEVMPNGEFKVFDIPLLCDKQTRGLPYTRRRDILQKVLPQMAGSGFSLVYSETDPEGKHNMLRSIEAWRGEGAMFKHVDSTYRFDYRSNEWLKWKLYKTCSVVITEMQREGKPEAVTICVYDGDKLHEVSGCKIPSRYQTEYRIATGDVIEVRYLSVSPDYKLIQPVFLAKRKDVSPTECKKEQLTP